MTRERFKLPKGDSFRIRDRLPPSGCPPLETVVSFWIAEQRYQFKLFKAVAEVGVDDLPVACAERTARGTGDQSGWIAAEPSAVDSERM